MIAYSRLLAFVVFTLITLQPSAKAQPARDPWRQPFAGNSIWNTPIGNGSTQDNINLNGIGLLSADVTYLYYSNPGDPTVNVYLPNSSTSYLSTKITPNYLSDASYGYTPNNPAFIMSGDFYGIELQLFTRTTSGGSISAYNASYNNFAFFNFLGDGLHGSHFGSGLSAGGGCLRAGELTGSGNIQHALQIELPTYMLYKNSSSSNNSGTYRWPASNSDGDISDYGTQNYYDSNLCMGALLTTRSGATAQSLGLTTAAGQKLFWTLQHYGAYIVETSGFSSYKPNGKDFVNIGIEAGAKQEFVDTFGYEFEQDSNSNNAWYKDVNAIYNNLAVIADNNSGNIGGAGGRLDSPIYNLAYGQAFNISNGTQIEAEDYKVGGQNAGYYDIDNSQNGRSLSGASAVYNRDGGGAYRNDGVDIYSTNDVDSGAPGYWAVGWTAAGEWLKYDINVQTSGYYSISIRGASANSGGQLHFNDENGNNLTGTITVNGTGGWDSYQNFGSSTFYLSAGNHTLQLYEDTGGYNINYFTFYSSGTSANPTTAAAMIGKTIALKALVNGSYVSADNYGNNPLIANKSSAGTWEQYTVVDAGGGNIALLAHVNNYYVCADSGGSSPLIANRTSYSGWEEFKVINAGSGHIALQALANGQYVCADNGGTSPLIANRTSYSLWEEFDAIIQ